MSIDGLNLPRPAAAVNPKIESSERETAGACAPAVLDAKEPWLGYLMMAIVTVSPATSLFALSLNFTLPFSPLRLSARKLSPRSL
jgi:hypothetical protein